MLFLKMSFLKIKQKDLHKIFSYISPLYKSSTNVQFINSAQYVKCDILHMKYELNIILSRIKRTTMILLLKVLHFFHDVQVNVLQKFFLISYFRKLC